MVWLKLACGKGLTPTEPKGNGGGGVGLRPLHIFSEISGIFVLGLTIQNNAHEFNS